MIANDALDHAHAGHMTGFDKGRAKGQLEASVDLARQWLLDLAHDAERQAIASASAKGTGWASEIARQASAVDW